MSEMNDIKEYPEIILPVNLKIFDQHQRENPSKTDKYKIG